MSDEKLNKATVNQLFWKNEKVGLTCCAIILHLCKMRRAYGDEIDFSFLGERDKNIVGLSWRLLSTTYGIVQKTGAYRKSHAEKANSRIIWEYILTNRTLAESLLDRRGALAELQLQLI